MLGLSHKRESDCINRKAQLVIAISFLLQGVTVAQAPSVPSHLANVDVLSFVPPPPARDYDKTVLIPLHKAQAEAKARQKAAEAAQAALIAQQAASIPAPTPMPHVAPVQPVQPMQSVQRVAVPGSAMQYIFQHESGGNPYAVNPSSGACGLGQALPCSKLTNVCNLGDTNCQINFFTQYAISRYGSWDAAAAFWGAHSWW